MKTQVIDVAIIGAGPAGLAAAIKAKEAGVEKITVFERNEAPGGLLDQCVHNGFGLTYFKEDLTGPEFAARFIEKALDLKVDVSLETMVLNITSDRSIGVCNKHGSLTLKAKAIILAMGCRERTREQIQIPGTRPSGVLTAGTAQRYINVDGFIPGKEIIILGSGDVGMIMARRLTLEGAQVRAVVEILPYVGGLIRNEVQCLVDFDIPLVLGHTITGIHGLDRITGVTIAEVDKNMEPISDTERKITCDTLLLSVGLIPENELSVRAGVKLNPLTGGPFVDEKRQTNIPGIFAAGNVAHVHDLVDNVVTEGEIAGFYAAQYVKGKVISAERRINMVPGEGVRYVIPNTISTKMEVDIYMRVKQPAEKVIVRVGNIFSKTLQAVKPSEMVKVKLGKKELSKINENEKEMPVSCRSMP